MTGGAMNGGAMNGGVMQGGLMNPQSAVLVANVALAWFLAGLIWTIQVVHYPLFPRVGREGFAAYEQAHGFDADAHARLVSSNWIRTVAWSARALLLAWCGWKALEAATGGTNP